MGKTRALHYKVIWIRQVLTGRAASKREATRRALALQEILTRGQGPDGARFRNAAELDALLLQADQAVAKTARRKPRTRQHSK
jgi:hypothetical protein